MRKGGYKIVDFKGAELSSTVVVRPGIYSQIIDDYDKAILVSGVSLSGNLKNDGFATVSKVTGDSGDSVELEVYDGVITVTEDDEVNFVLAKSPAELTAEIGDLDDLETTNKDSLVDAINEVKGEIGEIDGALDSFLIRRVVVNNTTDSDGKFVVNIPGINEMAYVLTNYSDVSANAYKITVSEVSNTGVSFRVRKYSDNAAVTNSQVLTSLLVIGK